MYKTVGRILEEIEQWRENSSTDDTLTSPTSIETFLEEIKEMNHAILREEEDAATEFPSILKLLMKKIKIASNNPVTRLWWYDVMTSRPPPLPKTTVRISTSGERMVGILLEKGFDSHE